MSFKKKENYLLCDTEHIKVIPLGGLKPCREMRSLSGNLDTESLCPHREGCGFTHRV